MLKALPRLAAILAGVIVLCTANLGAAQVKTTYVSLGGGAEAILYEPTVANAKSRVGIVVFHSFSSYMNFVGCAPLASAGYRVLCGSTPFTNNQPGYKGYEDHVPAIKAGVTYVKGIAGVSKVVLIGHSMGAPMMAFYQAVAEKGTGVCTDQRRIIACDTANLKSMPKADGVIILDSHLGDALATLTYTDPAVIDPANPGRRYQPLDMFDPANGYKAASNSADYSAGFKQNYLNAQAARAKVLLEDALARWNVIKSGTGTTLPDDMPFTVIGANAARLWQPDLKLLRQSKSAYLLLKGDGTRSTEVLRSVRIPSGKASDAMSYAGGTLPISVRIYLGAHAIRTNDTYNMYSNDLTGVDFESTNTSTVNMVENLSAPLLLMTMTGHYFIRPSEIILEHAASADKQLVGVEGAAHGITPCTACATTPGQFGDTVGHTFSFIDEWIAARF